MFAGADAVIHLAWLIQPSRDAAQLELVNVRGSRRVFETAIAAGVPRLVHASSVGVYSPGPKDRAVDESWPHEGVDSLFYSRHKAECERILDGLEGRGTTIVRLRPGLIFKREAGPEIRRLFAGPFLPAWLLKPGRIPVLPLPDRLSVQCVHGDDIGNAYRLAALEPHAEGAYNIAADPVLDPDTLAKVLGARRITLPGEAGADRSPTSPGARTCSPPRPAGSTWASPSRPWTPPARRSTSAGPRRSTRPPPCASCWPACASPRASTPHRSGPRRRPHALPRVPLRRRPPNLNDQ